MAAEGVTPPHINASLIGTSDGFHCSDLIVQNGVVKQTVKAVQEAGLANIHAWLQEFEPVSAK
jgi:hypothetical protein